MALVDDGAGGDEGFAGWSKRGAEFLMPCYPERLTDAITLYAGDCLGVLPRLDENSIDACCTDPPYHLTSVARGSTAGSVAASKDVFKRVKSGGFMGQGWDGGDIAFHPETWREVLRVLKPGAHLLAFGGTRTYHRMACAIEDAGFEIRDCVQWIYGQGFPKSLDVSKAIDRAAGAEREVVGNGPFAARRVNPNGGQTTGAFEHNGHRLSAPATARRWSGFGTSFKPACEMIALARKPLAEVTSEELHAITGWDYWCSEQTDAERKIIVRVARALHPGARSMRIYFDARTRRELSREDVGEYKPFMVGGVAANVLRWGTGALNIDGCRVDLNGDYKCGANGRPSQTGLGDNYDPARANQHSNIGRWPTNVILDGSEEVVAAFPDVGKSTGGRVANISKTSEIYGGGKGLGQDISADDVRGDPGYGDTGSAARFFYSAKADSFDRIGSRHPTIKPLDLIQYLVRLITPKRVTFCPNCEKRHAVESEKPSSSATLQRMRNDIQTEGQSARGPILQSTMRGESTGVKAGAMPMVQNDLSTAQGRSADVLQQTLFEQSGSETTEINARLCDEQSGIQAASHADTSSIARASGLHLRTSLGDGADDRSNAVQERSGPSHQWNQGRQSAGESSIDVKGRSRQTESSTSEHSELSALRPENHNQPTCSHCGNILEMRPGTVLDCFAGTGTTGEAAWREGMRAVLIEREAQYQDDIRRRMKLMMGSVRERGHESAKAKGSDKTPDAGPLFANVKLLP